MWTQTDLWRRRDEHSDPACRHVDDLDQEDEEDLWPGREVRSLGRSPRLP